MKSVDVSAIIPCKDSAATITRCLDSISSQSSSVREIVVVDDGSIDSTLKLVADWSSSRKLSVRVIDGGSSGAANARNLGVRAATSKWIAFCDSDDFWEPDKIERQLQWISGSDLVGVASLGYLANADGRVFGYHVRLMSEADCELLARRGNPVLVLMSSVLLRRSEFMASGGFDVSLTVGEDGDLWSRISRQGNIEIIPWPLFRYCYRADSLSMSAFLDTRLAGDLVALNRERERQRRPALSMQEFRMSPEFREVWKRKGRLYLSQLYYRTALTSLMNGNRLRGVMQLARSLAHSPTPIRSHLLDNLGATHVRLFMRLSNAPHLAGVRPGPNEPMEYQRALADSHLPYNRSNC